MKLRTKMDAGPTRCPVGSGTDIIYDAMAAHALMRAMVDVDQWPTAARVFKARADELLREWTEGVG